MSNTDFKILQANIRKSKNVSQSLFNDDALQSYSVILTTEPWVKLEGLVPITIPLTHTHWQPFFPSNKHSSPNHPNSPVFRSMIWINKVHTNVQQVNLMHHDICALILTLNDRSIFFASVDIPFSRGSRTSNNLRLEKRLDLLQQAFLIEKQKDGNLELVITGNFNRWDSLWGGNTLNSHTRQGEGQHLIDLMSDLNLQLLLPRGTITTLELRKMDFLLLPLT